MKKYSYFTVLIISVFILGMPNSLAQTTESKEAAKAAKTAERCTLIEGKINQRKTNIEKSISNLNASVTKIEGIVNKKISELNEKGVDTTQLTNNLSEFKNRANLIIASRQESINSLNSMDNSNCLSNSKTFSDNLRTYNTNLKNQNSSQKELKNYVRENIISVIKSLGKNNE
jgi:hypothetical protein